MCRFWDFRVSDWYLAAVEQSNWTGDLWTSFADIIVTNIPRLSTLFPTAPFWPFLFRPHIFRIRVSWQAGVTTQQSPGSADARKQKNILPCVWSVDQSVWGWHAVWWNHTVNSVTSRFLERLMSWIHKAKVCVWACGFVVMWEGLNPNNQCLLKKQHPPPTFLYHSSKKLISCVCFYSVKQAEQ